MKKAFKHALVLMCSLLMVAAFSPLPVSAVETRELEFVDANGNPVIASEYTVVTSDIDSMQEGVYVVAENAETSWRIGVQGAVDLIICDGATLKANSGINVPDGSSLTIWAQTTDNNGNLVIDRVGDDLAGIGGNDGTIAGDITINGCNLDIKGGKDGAAIGGGNGESSGYRSITINGGNVTATGGYNGAAIGNGSNNGSESNQSLGPITINGGVITATGGESGAGIGGGNNRGNGLITINGGKVTANCGNDAAAIGGGEEGSQDNPIIINGGEVEAQTVAIDSGGAAIGAGVGGFWYSSSGQGGQVVINGGTVHARGFHAMGCGNGATEDFQGTVELYKNAAVDYKEYSDWPGVDPKRVTATAKNRSYACTHNNEVWVEPCKHPEASYNATESYHILVCKYCEGDVEPEDHNVVVTAEAVEPTCTKKGKTEATKCSVCGIVLQTQKEVDALGHSPADPVKENIKKATYAKVGGYDVVVKCKRCGKTISSTHVVVPKLTVKPTTISKLTAARKGFTVKWNKGSSINGYELQYALNSKFTSGKKTVKITKAATLSRKVTKLKANKKYYVRIRTYKEVSGKTYRSKWSKTRTITTKK